MKIYTKKLLSIMLTLAMVFTLLPSLPLAAAGKDGNDYSITAFEQLPPDVAVQSVPLGTPVSKLKLPDTLTTSGSALNVATPSEPPQENDITIPGVTWLSAPEYEPNTEGTYIFTAVLPQGYDLADGVDAPVIVITVENSTLSGPSVTFTMPLNDSDETVFYLIEKNQSPTRICLTA